MLNLDNTSTLTPDTAIERIRQLRGHRAVQSVRVSTMIYHRLFIDSFLDYS